MSLAPGIVATITAVRASAEHLHANLDAARELDDSAIVEAQRALAEVRRVVDACSSSLAGEIGWRSRRELGYAGLAQREGFRSPEALVQNTTGSSAREAATLVRIGAMIHDVIAVHDDPTSETTMVTQEWERVVGRAASDGTVSVQAANAICTGLRSHVADRDDFGGRLVAAATDLVAAAHEFDVDTLLRRAREIADEVDAAGIADRERAIHDERGVRRLRRPNGVSRYIIDPDIESGAFWDDLYDSLTSPRRGGVRFVDDAQKAWAEQVATDPRTIEQYVHDSMTELLRISATADEAASRRIVGGRAPAVRILTTDAALSARSGHGRIEGSGTPVSIETVERMACSAGTVRIGFDEKGRVLDLGREQRLFTAAQRIALAARDGGCRHPDCDRPPSWTEAHHIRHWKRDGGRTDLADGILLCRFHHMLLHNNHWEIDRRHSEYWLVPPPDIDPLRTLRSMPSKSEALRDLMRRDLREPELSRASVIEAEPMRRPPHRADSTV